MLKYIDVSVYMDIMC